jgi:carbamoyltransferase
MILGLNLSHNGSLCLLDNNGDIVLYIEEERLSRKKRDFGCIKALYRALNTYSNDIELACIVDSYDSFDPLSKILRKRIFATIKKELDYYGILLIDYRNSHHLCHASNAFFASGYEDAIVMVLDGSGSYLQDYRAVESESYFYFRYGSEPKLIKRILHGDLDYEDETNRVINSTSVGYAFSYCSVACGFGFNDAGKIMGLAPYGNYDSSIPSVLNNDYYVDNKFIEYVKNVKGSYTDTLCKNLAYTIQNDSLKLAKDRILRCLDLKLSDNIIITGGYALNCVNNYLYLDFIRSKNIYIDPLGFDGGTSIGVARLHYYTTHNYSNRFKKLEHLFLGNKPQYISKIDNTIPLSVGNLVDYLLDKKTVAIYGGRCEAGPRALGNRSILFDPRHKDAKDIVNKTKKREFFRPFGCSIMKEHANNTFNMKEISDSPYMSYAVECIGETNFPGTTHIDNTSRLQTVESNHILYDILKDFYQKTGCPVLLHTSLNLAGEPLIETPEQAIETFVNSELDVLYFYDLGVALVK